MYKGCEYIVNTEREREIGTGTLVVPKTRRTREEGRGYHTHIHEQRQWASTLNYEGRKGDWANR